MQAGGADVNKLCHVVGCTGTPVSCDWFPALGVPLEFCRDHNAVPEADRAEWLIDLARARSDYEAGMAAVTAAVRT